MERALLVGVEFTDLRRRATPGHGPGQRELARAGVAENNATGMEDRLAELRQLAESAGAEVVGAVAQRRTRPDAGMLVGAGKVAEIESAAVASGADLVLFDAELSPTQQRNLERSLGVRVVARTQLILDIFARHARTREGQLQVELAQLEYLLPRLAGHGVAMSRLGGGIGTRGPGETKLETDRRRIHQRIRGVRTALERVRAQRAQQRAQRESVPLATVALVGYTNAGKSSLFNRLTGASVLASPRMFATLDPTLRSLRLPSRRTVLLSDTVGFLSQLPHGLISAFRATLEEVTRAAVLLVVSDVHSPQREAQLRQVQQVLRELGVEATPQIEVWNKADLLAPPATQPKNGSQGPVYVSARTGWGCGELLARLDETLAVDRLEEVRLTLPEPAGRWLHILYERGQVVRATPGARGVKVEARVPGSLLAQLAPFRTP